jgi:hypothetical protein
MPFKDPARRKVYHKQKSREYYLANRLAINKRTAKRYKENKAYHNAYTRQKDKELKYTVLLHYSDDPLFPVCACCREDYIEFLSIDHMEGNGNKHRREDPEAVKIYRWLKKHAFPKGFRVLCMNCNFALGHFGYCPHLTKGQKWKSRTHET